MQFLCTDSLVKIFPETKKVKRLAKATALLNDEYHLQLFMTSEEMMRELTIETSHAEAVKLYAEDYILGMTCNMPGADKYTIGKPGAFPDLLREPSCTDFFLRPQTPSVAFVAIDCEKLGAGLHTISFVLKNGKEVLAETKFSLEIVNEKTEEADLIVTNWLHYDCLANYYHIRPWTKRFFKCVENYVTLAVKMGINTVFVPCFTPPLDTYKGGHRTDVQLVRIEKDDDGYHFDFRLLDEFILMAKKCGVKYFEINHLFSQWGAEACPDIYIYVQGKKKRYFSYKTASNGKEYRQFLKEFLPRLWERIQYHEIQDYTLWHLSDEPNREHLPIYKEHKEFFKKYIPNGIIIDALSEYEFREIVDLPVVALDATEPFLQNNAKMMVYCCTGQDKHYESNRFFSIPSERHRVLGIMIYKTGALGFLHWGYNFYNSYLSKKPINPYWQADSAGRFQAGDAFIVYPGEKDMPELSLRLKIFNEALGDYKALKLLERKCGREYVIKLLEENGYYGLFEYPHSQQKLLALRDKINKMIAGN